jgi:hypothetical protein
MKAKTDKPCQRTPGTLKITINFDELLATNFWIDIPIPAKGARGNIDKPPVTRNIPAVGL